MPYEFEVQQKIGYLLITVSGSLDSVEDIAVFLKKMRAYVDKFGHARLLIDAREGSKNVDQHDCVTFANQWSLDNPLDGTKVAAVYSHDEVHNQQWIETILQNRSIIYKIFETMYEAEQWLMSRKTNTSN